MKRQFLSLTILANFLTLGSWSVQADETAKDFTVPSATDNSLIRMSDYAGKVVLINWWRTSCAWSQQEAPRLVSLYQKYKDNGLVIVGVSDDTADTVAQVPSYLKKYKIAWPVGLNDQGEFMRDIRPLGQGDTPGNYLVTRSGKITYLGLDRKPEDWQRLQSAIVAAVAEPAPAKSSLLRRVPSSAPGFELADLQGKTVRLKDFVGKPILVNFFNSQTCDWAGSTVARIGRDYGSRGLQVIGIDLFDDPASIRACSSKYTMSFPVLRGTQTVQQTWIGDSKAWAAFFVTRDGKMLKMIRDSIDNGLESTIFPKYAEYLLSQH